MQSEIRPTDLAGRWGGEEFVVFLSGASPRIAWERAEEIRKNIETVTAINPKTPTVTVSIGISIAGEDGISFANLFQAADSRMYKAKLKGRNQVYPDLSGYKSPRIQDRRKSKESRRS